MALISIFQDLSAQFPDYPTAGVSALAAPQMVRRNELQISALYIANGTWI